VGVGGNVEEELLAWLGEELVESAWLRNDDSDLSTTNFDYMERI